MAELPKAYYSDDAVAIYHGDCRELLSLFGPVVDCVITDPPYGDTSLDWDRPVGGWLDLIAARQLWCFGSMRFWLEHSADFRESWTYAQEVIWEKHNGSGFHADRFKRVHELAVHWYRGRWATLHKEPPMTFDALARQVVRRNKRRPAHMGDIGASAYASVDGGPRLMRSVLRVRSEHGRALHPTQKPIGILSPLIQFSVQADGLILDPFAGSGSTLLAAKQLGRQAIGIEIEERYCEIAAQRLAQDVLPLAVAGLPVEEKR